VWLEGFETLRVAWEKQYADAHAGWEAHKKQVEDAASADAAAREESGEAPTSYSSESAPASPAEVAEAAQAHEAEGALASDEALAALREKLTGH
jgi:small subunit ribosomal protein S1